MGLAYSRGNVGSSKKYLTKKREKNFLLGRRERVSRKDSKGGGRGKSDGEKGRDRIHGSVK